MKQKIEMGIICGYRGADAPLRGLRYRVVKVSPRKVLAWSDPQRAVGSTNKGMCWQGTPAEFKRDFLW